MNNIAVYRCSPLPTNWIVSPNPNSSLCSPSSISFYFGIQLFYDIYETGLYLVMFPTWEYQYANKLRMKYTYKRILGGKLF